MAVSRAFHLSSTASHQPANDLRETGRMLSGWWQQLFDKQR